MLIPVIPTTEVQVKLVQINAQGARKAVTHPEDTEILAKKNDGGMHLVLRHVVPPGSDAHTAGFAIRFRFPDVEAARTALLPISNTPGFFENGILLEAGEYVCIAVKPSIGLGPGTKFSLPYVLSIEPSKRTRQEAPGTGRPDEPVIVIQC